MRDIKSPLHSSRCATRTKEYNLARIDELTGRAAGQSPRTEWVGIGQALPQLVHFGARAIGL